MKKVWMRLLILMIQNLSQNTPTKIVKKKVNQMKIMYPFCETNYWHLLSSAGCYNYTYILHQEILVCFRLRNYMWEFHFQPYNCNCHVLLSSLLEEPKRLDHLQRVELDEIEGHHFYFVLILRPVKKNRVSY